MNKTVNFIIDGIAAFTISVVLSLNHITWDTKGWWIIFSAVIIVAINNEYYGKWLGKNGK